MSDLTSLGCIEEFSWPIEADTLETDTNDTDSIETGTVETGTIETGTIIVSYQPPLDTLVSEATKACTGTGVRECWAVSAPF